MSKRTHLALLAALTAMAIGATPLAAKPIDLQLRCEPEYGLLDQRQVRPADVRQHSPFSTYYLFDNPDLFEYRVSLINVGPERRIVQPDDRPWGGDVKLTVERDGAELGPQQLAVVPERRLVRRTEYLRDEEPIADLRFQRRLGRLGSDPSEPFDDYRDVEQSVRALPRELGTYEQAIVVFRLSAAGGGDLPHGLYTLRVADGATGARCKDQLIVIREPRNPLDVADSYIVRSLYHRAKGDLNAVAQELFLATQIVPDSLKAWYYRGALAYELGDLEGQVEAAAELERIVGQETGQRPEFVGLVKAARAFAAQAPELRRKLEQIRLKAAPPVEE